MVQESMWSRIANEVSSQTCLFQLVSCQISFAVARHDCYLGYMVILAAKQSSLGICILSLTRASGERKLVTWLWISSTMVVGLVSDCTSLVSVGRLWLVSMVDCGQLTSTVVVVAASCSRLWDNGSPPFIHGGGEKYHLQ